MRPLVTGQILEVDHPHGQGRFWANESLYVYSLLWDPFILSRTRAVPETRLAGEPVANSGNAFLFYPHPVSTEDSEVIREVLDAGGRTVLNCPGEELFAGLRELHSLPVSPHRLVSLRERWDLGPLSSRTYFYADRESFVRLEPSRGTVLSRIGDNPDLMVLDRLALFAGNPFATLMRYLNVPTYGTLLLDISGLLSQMVALMLDAPLSAHEAKAIHGLGDLRRDFHAFGYAYLTILELERCYGGNRIDLDRSGRCALDAAQLAVAGDPDGAVGLLATGFKMLEEQNRKLQPTPAVFTDTLHGGGLFPDLGYFEFDWPQHAADVLKEHLRWATNRSYRFNVDFGAESVANMAARFPLLFDALKAAQAAGQVEFVNGTMNQPYPPFHTLESQIRQFDCGRKVWEEVFGCPPRTYASQEFGFCPQLAAILAQQGYEQVVLRVQNMGDAPTLKEERILWTAHNGDQIQALPSHPYKTEQRNEATYNNLHLKLFAHQETGLDFAVFSGLGDITYYRPFREELARICHYAPVFGRFQTWSRYFADRPRHGPTERRFTMEDFDCRAGFLELGLWSVYQNVTGNFNSHCTRSMAATHLFSAAEMLESVIAATLRPSPSKTQRPWDWASLAVYQGHDTYIVPHHPAGGFMGGVNNPSTIAAGHARPNVADYCGPWDWLPVLKRSERDLKESERNAEKSLRRNLRRLVDAMPDRDRYVVYSFGPARPQVLRVKGGACKVLTIGGIPIETQNVGQDLLALVSLPDYGYVVVDHTEGDELPPTIESNHTWAGPDFLENSVVRVELDLERGTMRRLIRKSDGKSLLGEAGHVFYLPNSRDQRCLGAKILMEGPLRACLELEVEVTVQRGRKCRIRSRISLDANETLVRFEERVLRCPEIRGDQWDNHLGVRFAVPEGQTSWMQSHFNVLEPASEVRVFSPNLLLARVETADLLFVNSGNEFYLCEGNQVSNVLIFENEPAREFAYAIGLAEGNPLMQARAWAQPHFIERIPRSVRPQARHRIESLPGASFFSVDSRDIEITSCRYESGAFLLRLANTCDRVLRTTVSSLYEVAEAYATDLRGLNAEPLAAVGGKVCLEFRPWDIREVRLKPSHGHLSKVKS